MQSKLTAVCVRPGVHGSFNWQPEYVPTGQCINVCSCKEDAYQLQGSNNSQLSQSSQVSNVSRGMFGGFSEEDVEVDFSEVQMGPRIGVGCFGEVFKARWRQTTVAVKRLFDQTLTDHSLKVWHCSLFISLVLEPPSLPLPFCYPRLGSYCHVVCHPREAQCLQSSCLLVLQRAAPNVSLSGFLCCPYPVHNLQANPAHCGMCWSHLQEPDLTAYVFESLRRKDCLSDVQSVLTLNHMTFGL